MDIKSLLQYKNLIVSLVIIIIVGILAQLMFSYYSLQESSVDTKNNGLEVGKQAIDRWRELKGEINELDDIFLAKDPLAIKKFVEEKANAFDIKIISLNTSDEETNLYWEITVQLGMECIYKDFTAFIKSVEEKSIIAEDIRIISDKGSNSEKINLKLKGFVLK
ncbi:MAG: hypothetical protein P9M02_04115 [Candidatus Susulua stagnicola]|nr:hypothetical protein [Candidatus Susulua stagnicola]